MVGSVGRSFDHIKAFLTAFYTHIKGRAVVVANNVPYVYRNSEWVVYYMDYWLYSHSKFIRSYSMTQC